MRYLLAISGLLVAAVVALGVWMVLPRGGTGSAVQAQQQPAEEVIGPEQSGEGSFRVCNETPNRVSIAFGYRSDKGWQSEGWWVADPTSCVTVYRGDLDARRYYYVYAADDVGGGAWDGNVFMCTRDESFTIFGVEDCLARGYERTGFFEIDTQNKSDWTLQLTESDQQGEGVTIDDTMPLGDEEVSGEDGPFADELLADEEVEE